MSGPIPDRLGDYRIIRLLGEGGMGTVYLGRTPDGNLAAVKLLRDEIAEDSEYHRRFRREARLALAFDHPNIVRTFDAGCLEGRLFMASAFVDGGDLQNRMDAQPPLPSAAAVRVVRDLLRALTAVEEAGLVHRDVKPGNLLIEGDGKVLLADLGLARSTAPMRSMYTQYGQFYGTLPYASPEQLEVRPDLDIRSDLYAAGAVLHYLLTKKPPVEGTQYLDYVRHFSSGRRPAPPSRPLPIELQEFLDALLAIDRDARPRTAQEAASRADEILTRLLGQGEDDRLPQCVPQEVIEAGMRTTVLDPARPLRATYVPALGDDAGHPRTVTWAAPALLPQSRRAVLRPSGPSRVHRIDFRITSDDGHWFLSLFAGTRLSFGRGKDNGAVPHVPLRLFPVEENVEKIGKISSKHFEIFERDGDFSIADLRSTCGTQLNGKALVQFEAHELMPRNEVLVAGVLMLVLRVVPKRRDSNYHIEGYGDCADGPSVVVERERNGREYVVALVPGAFELARGLEVIHAQGSLFLRSSAIPPHTCREPAIGWKEKHDGFEFEVIGVANRE